jgi:hypothetical protein
MKWIMELCLPQMQQILNMRIFEIVADSAVVSPVNAAGNEMLPEKVRNECGF